MRFVTVVLPEKLLERSRTFATLAELY